MGDGRRVRRCLRRACWRLSWGARPARWRARTASCGARGDRRSRPCPRASGRGRFAAGALVVGGRAAAAAGGQRRPGARRTRAARRGTRSRWCAGPRGSVHGLEAMARGQADAAVLHLLHARVRALQRPLRPPAAARGALVLVHLWRREVGLVVPRGNPLAVRGVADLAGLRVAWRARGSGSRLLLERLLAEAGVEGAPESGEPADSHFAVAAAVAAGAADAGLAVRAVARRAIWTSSGSWSSRSSWRVRGSAVDSAAGLLARLHDPAVREPGRPRSGGYDLTRDGSTKEGGMTRAAVGGRGAGGGGCRRRPRCGSDRAPSTTTTPSGQMILATTTSTRDTGLLDTLVPAFEKAGQVQRQDRRGRVRAGARPRRARPGRRAAGALARRRADVHEAGPRLDGVAVMHNDFVLVGPPGRSRRRPPAPAGSAGAAGHRRRRSRRSPRAPTTRAPTPRSSSSGSRRASRRRARGTSRPARGWARRSRSPTRRARTRCLIAARSWPPRTSTARSSCRATSSCRTPTT